MMVAVASAEAVAFAEALGAAVEEELVRGAGVARHLAVLLLHPPTLGEVEVARLK